MKKFTLLPKKEKFLVLDIGTDTIKFIVGRYDDEVVTVYQCFTETTPSECFQDEKIVELQKLADIIKEALAKHNVKEKATIITIENSKILKREIILPMVGQNELKEMVRYEIGEYLPIELGNYVTQFKLVEKVYENEVEKQKVLVSMLSKEFAEDYLELLHLAQLKPIALDIHSNAISKILYPDSIINGSRIHDKTIAIIDLGHTFINITILEKGIYKFNRILKTEINLYHTQDYSKFNISDLDFNFSDEDSIFNIPDKEEFADHIDINKPSDFLDDKERLENTLMKKINDWIEDINKIFKYYTTREANNEIDAIYLYGGFSQLQGIKQYMENLLLIPTYTLDEIHNVMFENELEAQNLSLYVNAIASIIRL